MLRSYSIRSSRMCQRLILNPTEKGDIPIKGVIFDMDGTLCLPQTWMFAAMRDAIGLADKSIDILKFIDALSPENQTIAKKKIADVEEKAMKEMEPQPGLIKLLHFITENNVSKAICTRNLIKPVNHLMNSFIPDHKFDPIVTRDFTPTKPHPAPIQHIAESWNTEPKNLIMVGDSIDDMKSGKGAGATTVLIRTHANDHIRDIEQTDYVIDRLDDLIKMMQNGLDLKN